MFYKTSKWGMLVILVSFSVATWSDASERNQHGAMPKLILAIVVDQMRADYLDRFHDLLSTNGFDMLMQKGSLFTRCNYDHAPTNTAPGHSTLLSGIYSGTSGVISNEWYNAKLGRIVYCVEDSLVYGIGVDSSVPAGKMSPKNFNGITIGDLLRTKSPKSKVFGIAMKDRGAILPAGKHPTGAFWFDPQSGNWISSSYYYESLPTWAQNFNNRRLAESYLEKVWFKLLPETDYLRQGVDSVEGEGVIPGETSPIFPHRIADLSKEPFASNPQYSKARRFDALLPTPMGNDLTVKFAEAAINGERLGQRDASDILAVSFSSIDFCGHIFGPDSYEIEDIFVRLDRQLAGFFAFVDSTVGLQNTVIVLTSDHGVTPLPEKFTHEHATRLNSKDVLVNIKVRVGQTFNYDEGTDNLLSALSNGYVYLDYPGIKARGFNSQKFESSVGQAALKESGIARYFTRTELERSIAIGGSSDPIQRRIEHGFNENQSGGVALLESPHSIFWGPTGVTHGTPYEYDTHVPLIFFGPGICAGINTLACSPNDIAPTIASILEISVPPHCAGVVLSQVFDKMSQSMLPH